ncbi:MAG: hypothetical protein HYY76_10655 [Acidobacteria bacterium]|nr:hypothetical protein [Acidobacteriota bacterium]
MAKFESLDPEIRGVLGKKVSELGLRVEGSPVEGYVRQLYTGVPRAIVRGLIDSICRTCERMKLWGERGEEARYLVEITALATTLAMNFLTRGRFET